MARLSSPGLQASQSPDFNRSSAELGLLLSRLTQNVIHADPEREQRLRTNEYERAKLETNLEYARTALTKLEQDALHVLAPGRRVEMQTDLNQKREQLELLLDRLEDLHKMAVDPEDDDSEGEDILAGMIQTPSASESMTSDAHIETPSTTDTPEPSIPEVQPQAEPEPEQATPQPPSPEPPTQTSSTLRPRTSHATARQALFASRRPKSPSALEPSTTTATAEAILSREASEREYLADRVLQMAQAMKKKQIDIAADLESEKDVLGRATEGMERAGRAMDTVRGAMNTVTRMAEGEGWWGRMMLYAWIYGMMVALTMLVFVLPKLRF